MGQAEQESMGADGGSEKPERWEAVKQRLDLLAAALPGEAAANEGLRAVRDLLDALRESEDRFESAFRYAPVGMALATLDGRGMKVNEALCAMLGYSEAEIVAAPALAFVHPEDRAAVPRRLSELKSGRVENYSMERRYIRRDGEIVWALTSASVIHGHDGRAKGLVVQIQDISELRRAEERARQHEAELAHVLRVQTVGEMASGLAHELNQPLGAIVAFAKGCERRCRAGTMEATELLRSLGEITREAMRAGEIIRRLRRMLRKEAPRLEHTDLNGVVSRVVELVDWEARSQGIRVTTALAQGVPPVVVDVVQIEQVILNLVRNGLDAIRASLDGARELVVRTAPSGAEGAEVVVEDSGVGLTSEQIGKIFSPFYTTKEGGLGMGLCISRSIVEAHRGTIWVKPREGGGATAGFTIHATKG